jgi:hypothetical protein
VPDPVNKMDEDTVIFLFDRNCPSGSDVWHRHRGSHDSANKDKNDGINVFEARGCSLRGINGNVSLLQ